MRWFFRDFDWLRTRPKSEASGGGGGGTTTTKRCDDDEVLDVDSVIMPNKQRLLIKKTSTGSRAALRMSGNLTVLTNKEPRTVVRPSVYTAEVQEEVREELTERDGIAGCSRKASSLPWAEAAYGSVPITRDSRSSQEDRLDKDAIVFPWRCGLPCSIDANGKIHLEVLGRSFALDQGDDVMFPSALSPRGPAFLKLRVFEDREWTCQPMAATGPAAWILQQYHVVIDQEQTKQGNKKASRSRYRYQPFGKAVLGEEENSWAALFALLADCVSVDEDAKRSRIPYVAPQSTCAVGRLLQGIAVMVRCGGSRMELEEIEGDEQGMYLVLPGNAAWYARLGHLEVAQPSDADSGPVRIRLALANLKRPRDILLTTNESSKRGLFDSLRYVTRDRGSAEPAPVKKWQRTWAVRSQW